MAILDYFRRRPDGRCEPHDTDFERQLDANLAARKAIRNEPDPHKRGWLTRKFNGVCK